MNDKTLTEKVADEIEKKILEGAFGWRHRDKLPTQTTLARQFNVSRCTMSAIAQILKERDLIYLVPQVGTFVKYSKFRPSTKNSSHPLGKSR